MTLAKLEAHVYHLVINTGRNAIPNLKNSVVVDTWFSETTTYKVRDISNSLITVADKPDVYISPCTARSIISK